MRDPLPIEITELAARHIRKADRWWRDNRKAAPNAVREELDHAFTLIASQPFIGGRADNVKLEGVRRIFLSIIKQYLYYKPLTDPERVQVVALWHTRRGSGPPI
jgi:ParE toxin of type II toxin-antitoxin system, parDE